MRNVKIITKSILNNKSHKGVLPAVSSSLLIFVKNLIAGKKIVFGAGGYIFNNNHIPGIDNKPHNAIGLPKDSADKKDIIMS